ncbi:MAG: peptidoglycan DD-metalloendopeptidase family protein [Faecalibacterium sp.]|nr:peptidoglycan DD-metalloendopeptidase family protein [Ruminococcus sp.]MCM1391248.1 peptidoglycan DD-metalloendopeptidase family protein [Ruminococcus sp.]MCM1484778.1 peptidoglycan DD-metalloendopeptidase family protein [Faecalibacterium sp.]
MKRFFAVLMCAVTVWLCVSLAGTATVAHAATKQELQDRIDQIDEEIKQNKDKLASLADKKEQQQEYLDTLDKQISAAKDKVSALDTQVQTIDNEIDGYDKQIKKLKNEISIIKDEIKVTNTQISETQNSIDDSKDLLAQKLRTAYIQGNDSTLKILMGSENLAQFLTSLEMMKRMSEEDSKVINNFKEQVTTLKDAKKELETKQTSLTDKQDEIESLKSKSVARKKELTSKQAEYNAAEKQLEKNYEESEKYIENLDKNSEAYKAYINKLSAEREQADKEIEEIISRYMATTTKPTTTAAPTSAATSQSQSNNTANSSTSTATTASHHTTSASWGWPLGNAYCYISSGFGNRNPSISGWGFHGGVDIAGCGGQPIYATRSGTVITAIWGTTGYGRYVVIDHGDGYVSLYGHCASLSVSSGQHVEKGQQIAIVGETGNARGKHLHFEIRHNGVKQNPMNYVHK